ncbi:hypothetical protein O181_082214 [Austropuccinia psidii MF-1]|uniref:Uncharacterized protein n=1 Tax=Austropuccinia psidii MF-1 TaxID=1389203 RepID=A0A9Q3IKU3_9BASI|nr:hypothetical protein [Austropuccinia psidii MF-1]
MLTSLSLTNQRHPGTRPVNLVLSRLRAKTDRPPRRGDGSLRAAAAYRWQSRASLETFKCPRACGRSGSPAIVSIHNPTSSESSPRKQEKL